MLVAEAEEKKLEKERVVNSSFPPLKMGGLSVQELQDLCKDLHRKIDVVDEARYDMQIKVAKNESEIQSLNQKIIELKGVKRPNLKRVKKTTDDMLGAYTDTSKLMKADFKVNLKTVKKEDEKTKLLKMAAAMLEKEKEEKKQEREVTLNEKVPALQLSALSVQDLQALCKELHHKIDVVDEERYDIDVKVAKNNKEVHVYLDQYKYTSLRMFFTHGFDCFLQIENLSQKIFELKGKMKRPALKRVKISADAMLGALLGAKVKESVDFKVNLKTVKKVEEQIRLLAVAAEMLQEETERKMQEREAALAERVPPLKLSGLSMQELLDLCKDMHHKIDVVDEERYDISLKVSKNDKEIENLNLKITEIQSKFKKPTLRRVKISAEAMLSVLLGSRHKDSFDFKANLKTVKKEEEKKDEVTDWRKNVEAMSGMEGRKKLFDASGN
ncbi:Troponin I [Nibea albiflora]|uniref:Troponin I n=1 Tax=Nibea albiflora TaxID=240163 RepID=A0ACB7FFJ7_NIBAL|nr:Troponin I [Nibea albiflora]